MRGRVGYKAASEAVARTRDLLAFVDAPGLPCPQEDCDEILTRPTKVQYYPCDCFSTTAARWSQFSLPLL